MRSLAVFFTNIGIYVILTFPGFMFTISEGRYGIDYPFWGYLICSIVAIVLSVVIVASIKDEDR